MTGSRVVVTGGSGFIGRHLVRGLVAAGAEVSVFDSAEPAGDAVVAGVRYLTGDIRNPEQVSQAITEGVDVVYHLAAVVGVDQYLARPLDVIDINFSGARTVLEQASVVGAKVVVASTSEVFGKNPAVPWAEDGDRVLGPTTADRWAYSSSKALTEHLTFGFVRQRDLRATIVRYFNVYGPGQRPAYVVSRSIHRALNGHPPVVYDHGGQTRCFTYVADAVRGTMLAGSSDAANGKAFNLGSTRESTVGEVIELVTKLTGLGDPALEVDTSAALGPAYQDLARRVPDTTRAREVLGWTCETDLADGLAMTIDWARAHPGWLALPDTGAA
jgi:nucleoside-diphosphate-sugar epimerase